MKKLIGDEHQRVTALGLQQVETAQRVAALRSQVVLLEAEVARLKAEVSRLSRR